MSRIFLDTNIFIYFYEDAGPMTGLTRSLFERLDRRGDQIVTSALTIGELLVHPLRMGNDKLAALYEKVLQPPAIEIVPFDRACSTAFARIRLDKSIKPPDAIQLACAATARCDLFLTNDQRLTGKIVPGLQFISALEQAPV
ncbi:MAG: PIN domain-containing protein [Acidobacteria bacterium]|nr:PIN domain-containing protein [Acidobacteriota bacterium]